MLLQKIIGHRIYPFLLIGVVTFVVGYIHGQILVSKIHRAEIAEVTLKLQREARKASDGITASLGMQIREKERQIEILQSNVRTVVVDRRECDLTKEAVGLDNQAWKGGGQ